MKKHLLFRAFLPLAAYAVFTELALHGLAGILAAAPDGWTGAASLNLSAAVLWANAAAGLAVSGLFWRQYGREEEEGKAPERRLDLRREEIGSFLLLIALVALGICCCLGGSGLIFLLSGHRVLDVTSGFRATNARMTAYFARHYAIDYPEPEAALAAILADFKVAEAPVIMRERQGGVSSIHSFKSVYYMIKVSLALIIDRLSIRKSKGGRA